MNYHKFIGDNISIDKSINGWKELDILRRLRNQFSHRDGKLNPSNGVQVKLVKEIIMNFRLVDQEYDHIPISIDLVIKPIFEGCKVYALEKILKNKTGS